MERSKVDLLAEANKKVQSIDSAQKRPRFLSEQDLAEFRLQLQTLTAAKNNCSMVEAGYQVLVRELKEKYQISSTKFTIDPASGEISDTKEAANG